MNKARKNTNKISQVRPKGSWEELVRSNTRTDAHPRAGIYTSTWVAKISMPWAESRVTAAVTPRRRDPARWPTTQYRR